MGERRRKPNLALEARELGRALSRGILHRLDRRRPAHECVLGQVHLTHTALPQLALDEIVAEPLGLTERLPHPVKRVGEKHRDHGQGSQGERALHRCVPERPSTPVRTPEILNPRNESVGEDHGQRITDRDRHRQPRLIAHTDRDDRRVNE